MISTILDTDVSFRTKKIVNGFLIPVAIPVTLPDLCFSSNSGTMSSNQIKWYIDYAMEETSKVLSIEYQYTIPTPFQIKTIFSELLEFTTGVEALMGQYPEVDLTIGGFGGNCSGLASRKGKWGSKC